MSMLGNRFSQHSMATIPSVHTERSSFDRSHTVKTTFDFDYLVPFMVDEILPGDDVSIRVNTFGRLATQLRPIMDNLYIDFFFFFVPNRLVWSNWEKFCGAQDNPGDSISYLYPILTLGSAFAVGSIYDQMGIPTGVANVPVKNTLPLRSYNLIWNKWFRDENFQNSVTVATGDGPDAQADFTLLKRGKRFDYFTSSLPSPQKGTAVMMPLGSRANVMGLAVTNTAIYTNTAAAYNTSDGISALGSNWTGPSPNVVYQGDNTSKIPNLYADLSTATAATINQFRQAIMVQSLLELDARGGTRYVEILLAHFNVVSPDFRLQRPEYLGGGSTRINAHPVAQTAPTAGSAYAGDLSAFATTSTQGENIGCSKSFVEHGHLIGLMCARADITYQQGLNRMWSRQTRYDIFWPKLQQMGEQSVLLQEIYCAGNGSSGDTTVWGYQERNAEYRFYPSGIRGQFRSTYTTPLDMYHMADKYTSAPALNSTWIQQTTPIARALAYTATGAQLLMDMWISYKHARPMMTYAVPASLGRF